MHGSLTRIVFQDEQSINVAETVNVGMLRNRPSEAKIEGLFQFIGEMILPRHRGSRSRGRRRDY